jgi:hypothetical protein
MVEAAYAEISRLPATSRTRIYAWFPTDVQSCAADTANLTYGFAATNGQVERMNHTFKEATVRRYHYDSHHQLRQHIQTFLNIYNIAKRRRRMDSRHSKPSIKLDKSNQSIQIRSGQSHFRDTHLPPIGIPGEEHLFRTISVRHRFHTAVQS